MTSGQGLVKPTGTQEQSNSMTLTGDGPGRTGRFHVNRVAPTAVAADASTELVWERERLINGHQPQRPNRPTANEIPPDGTRWTEANNSRVDGNPSARLYPPWLCRRTTTVLLP